MIENCRLVYVDGVANVFDDKGAPSSLYKQALEYTEGNQEEAVQIWSATQSEEFELEVGEDSPTLPTVLRFLNNRVSNPKSLSSEELKEVSLLMSDLGISDLDEFTKKMNSLFQPNGYYAVDTKKLMDSGMYSLKDISELDDIQVKSFLERLNYFNEHKTFKLTSAPQKVKVQLRNTTAKKTPIGSYPLVSEQEFVEYIIDNSEDLSESNISKTIGESPFAQILDDKKAMKAVMQMLQGKTKVNKMFFDGEKFTSENIDTFVTLRNTLLANADPIELEADLEFLESIPENIWESKQSQIKGVLKEIEQTAVKYNIDIIGISDFATDRASVMEILSALDDMLLAPSMENIKNFAEKKDSKIAPTKPYTVVELEEDLKGYNIVKIDTNLSDDVMFQRGFLKVNENGLYHRVQRTDLNSMYEVVYDMVMDGRVIIPSEYFAKDLSIRDTANKEAVIDGIRNYVSGRDTGIESSLNEEISLFQTIFAHKNLKNSEPQDIETDGNYLKTEFVSDFYNYILKEKQAKTDLYNKVLRYFTVTDGDITLDALSTPDITGIKFEKELRDYSKLKKGGQIKELSKGASKNVDLMTINNPKTVAEERGLNFVMGENGYVLSETNPNTYLKTGGKLYRKLFDKANGALYKEVKLEKNSLYFDNNLNFSYDRKEAESAYKELNKSLQKTPTKTAKELAENVNIPTVLQPIQFSIATPTQNQLAIQRNNGNPLTLAPNGQPSILYQSYKDLGYTDQEAENLVAQVYSDSFISWFGDWINNPKSASKVVDKNGQPRLVFHGTNNTFTEFSKDLLGSKNWLAESAYMGFFFAGNQETSKAYTGFNMFEINLKYPNLIKEVEDTLPDTQIKEKIKINQEKQKEYIVEKLTKTKEDLLKRGIDNDTADFLTKMYNSSFYNQYSKEAFEKIKDESIKQDSEKLQKNRIDLLLKLYKDRVDSSFNPNILNIFLNIRKPYVFDFKDSEERGLPYHIQQAKESQNDGVIFENLKDGAEEDSIYVAFEPNQIKSATENVGTFSADNNDIRFQIIGEQGASRMIEYKRQLDRAKELEKDGKTPAQVELETGWYKYKGDWRTIPKEVVKSFKIKDKTINKELTLKQVLGDDNVLFKFYPEVGETKVIFLGETYEGISVPSDIQQSLGLFSKKDGTIFINTFTDKDGRGGRERISETDIRKTLGHEVNHRLQQIEGFPVGGDRYSVIMKAREIVKSDKTSFQDLYEDMIAFDTNNLSENEKVIVDSTIKAFEQIRDYKNDYPLTVQYYHLMGEIDSRIVEEALMETSNYQTISSYSALLDKVAMRGGINLDNVTLLYDNEGFKLNLSPQKTEKETVDEIIEKLKQTGLSEEVFQLNTAQLLEKLKEIGVSDDVAMRVSSRFEQRGGVRGDKFTSKEKPEKVVVLFNKNSVFKKLVNNDVSSTLRVIEDYLDIRIPFSPTITELESFNEILGNAVDNDLLNYSLIEEDTNVSGEDIKALLKIIEDKVDKEQIQFRKALSQQGINLIPNGFVYKNQVFLNTDTMTPDLIFHEFSHLFSNWQKENRPDIYSKGLSLIEEELKRGNKSEITDVFDFVNKSQPNLTGNDLLEEYLTEFIGRYSKQMMDEQKAKSPLMQWLSDFWTSVKDLLGIVEMSPAQVANLSLQEYAKASVVSLSKGEKITLEKQQEKGFNEGIEFVQKVADEYRAFKKIKGLQHPKVLSIYPQISEEIAIAYDEAEATNNSEEVEKAYQALEDETIEQYNFIIEKGLKVDKWSGKGEPYASSKDMLKDLKDNNHLYFLPNEEAFGSEGDKTENRKGLKKTDIFLKDGYQMTLSEVFRVVHDYFGHGILGNQFGAIGEENATLQHLDLYSKEALPAVIFQTRGQNSWVNFSNANKEALAKIKEARQKNDKNLLEESQKMLKFAQPKDNIFPNKYNFKKYETARRIKEQSEIDKAPNQYGSYEISNLLPIISRENVVGGGISSRSTEGNRQVQSHVLKDVKEVELSEEVRNSITRAFPQVTVFPKIYEITDGAVYRDLKIKGLVGVPMSKSVTIYSEEEYSDMRLFITEDGHTGITLRKDGHLGGAFASPKSNRKADLAQLLVIGIKEGATNAEAYHTFLPDYYSAFGFKAVSRVEFNEEIAGKEWDYEEYKRYNNGKPDVVHFIYDGGDRNSIETRLTQFDTYDAYQIGETKFFDKNSYMNSVKYMQNEVIKRNNFEKGISTPAPKVNFQKVVHDARVAERANVFQLINDFGIVIKNIYPKSQENEIKDKFDECRI